MLDGATFTVDMHFCSIISEAGKTFACTRCYDKQLPNENESAHSEPLFNRSIHHGTWHVEPIPLRATLRGPADLGESGEVGLED